MENTSVLCDEIIDFCVGSTESAVLSYFNIFSVILNILNLIVLKKLDKSKRNAYFWTVINIGICDIVTCSAFSLAFNCELNRQIITLPITIARIFQVTITILSAVPFVVRNFGLAMGSYERHISICFPYQVTTNKIVNNMKGCLGIVWLISFALITTSIVTDTNEYCFSDFGAMPSKPNKQTSAAFAGSITIAFITSVICLSKTWRELKRMQSRSRVPAQDDLIVKRSAQYIVIVSITLYLSYIPTVISVMFNSFDNIAKNLKDFTRWISYFYTTVYNIFNVLVYFFITPGYRIHVMNLLKLKKSTVRPN